MAQPEPLTTTLNADLMSISTRKVVMHTEDLHLEGGVPVPTGLRRAVVCAVFRNPWAGMGFVDDLWDEMNRVARILSLELAQRVLEVMGGSEQIGGFGKCAIVGLDGEIEHGAALIHCPGFGPHIRGLLQGTAGISSTERRSAAGTTVSIPMNHKTQRATRAYYQAIDFTLHDAPHPDELAIALAVTSGPRPHARIGDLTTDAARATPDFGPVAAPRL
jgi:Amino acid synthesis